MDGLGTYTVATIYAALIVSCLFVPTIAIQKLGLKGEVSFFRTFPCDHISYSKNKKTLTSGRWHSPSQVTSFTQQRTSTLSFIRSFQRQFILASAPLRSGARNASILLFQQRNSQKSLERRPSHGSTECLAHFSLFFRKGCEIIKSKLYVGNLEYQILQNFLSCLNTDTPSLLAI